jgi:hypothetical protein
MTEAMKWLFSRGWTAGCSDIYNKPLAWRIDLHGIRDEFIAKFGFAILNDEAIEAMREFAPILEVGCGSAYWSYELNKAGILTIATDPGTGHYAEIISCGMPWMPMKRLKGVEAVESHQAHTLLIVWPDLGPLSWSSETLAAYRGQTVIYVGEYEGGCTGDERFHEILHDEFAESGEVLIPTFPGIHDSLQIWPRK